MTKSHLEKEMICVILQFPIHPGKTLRRERGAGTLRWNLKQRSGRNAAYWFALAGSSAFLLNKLSLHTPTATTTRKCPLDKSEEASSSTEAHSSQVPLVDTSWPKLNSRAFL